MYSNMVCSSDKVVLKLLVYLTSLILCFAPTYALAAIPPRPSWMTPLDYQIESMRIRSDALSADIKATRQQIVNGSNQTIRSTAIARVDTSAMVRNINRVGAVAVVAASITALLGAVDYVMDPANNRVKYWKQPDTNPQYWWVTNTIELTGASTPALSCEKAYTYYTRPTATMTYKTVNSPDSTNWFCPSAQFGTASRGALVLYKINPNYNPNGTPEEKYLPYSDVANKIADDAKSGDTAAQDYQTDAIANELQNNPAMQEDVKKQLQNNESTDPDTDTPPDPNDPPPDPDSSFKLPAFCTWASFLCLKQTKIEENTRITKEEELKQTEQDKNFFKKVTDWLDWTKEEPEQPDQQDYEIQQPNISAAPNIYIQAQKQCPSDRRIPISLGGYNTEIVLSYQPLCIVAEQFAPAVVLMSSISAMMIVTGTGRRAEVEG